MQMPLETAGAACRSWPQSLLATSRALKSWAFAPVTMQVPLKTADIVYRSGRGPERLGNFANVEVVGLFTEHDADALMTSGAVCLSWPQLRAYWQHRKR